MRLMLQLIGHRSPFTLVWDQDVAAILAKGVVEHKEGIFNVAGDGVLTTKQIAARLGKFYLPVPAFVLRGLFGVLHPRGLCQYAPEQVKFVQYRPVGNNAKLKEFYVPRKTSEEVFALWGKKNTKQDRRLVNLLVAAASVKMACDYAKVERPHAAVVASSVAAFCLFHFVRTFKNQLKRG
eukprot:NODE_442_length_914_cov_352.911504_g434_i0.p1 GENE.NODE_442_length_914_cov_352.911504_g434_i0~~NODE_442_length_914_cov_352.911504_g434_i0.p1  ORF type:complete len:180 (+),score=9.34 NODE_442_length_914_cov_352.911504_g434_i0:292-831(+)